MPLSSSQRLPFRHLGASPPLRGDESRDTVFRQSRVRDRRGRRIQGSETTPAGCSPPPPLWRLSVLFISLHAVGGAWLGTQAAAVYNAPVFRCTVLGAAAGVLVGLAMAVATVWWPTWR
jgi:hypothetical protein